ncbi:MAG: IS66 family transposase [Polyangiaceae bacterium]|nr:IS66 family transposase [Polyangiaceae bacterium]
MTGRAVPSESAEELRKKLAERDARLAERDEVIASLRAIVSSLEGQTNALQSALVSHATELELLRRKLYGSKSERTNTDEFQLLLQGIFGESTALQKHLDDAQREREAQAGGDGDEPEGKAPKDRPKPKGRRNLSASSLPRVTVDISDADLAIRGRFIGWDESFQLLYVRGGFRVLVKRVARFEVDKHGEKSALRVEQPRALFPRALCHTSVFAWLAVEKFALGVPFYRLEKHLGPRRESLDRGTMCRYMEDLGGTLGATVVAAMFEDARAHCHVLSTDATGAAIQPEQGAPGGRKQACKKGHFFTIVADCDHVLYHYASSHSSNAVKELFAGFSGFLQSDASAVYDILERGPPKTTDDGLTLVGCWAHCRRYFFDAAVTKHAGAVEGLRRMQEIYRAAEPFAKLPPIQRKDARAKALGPLIDDFFVWVAERRRNEPGRTLFTRALGYATNQEAELRRVLSDGRLALDNTRSERALRTIVVGRKNWLFYGSDVHAQAAAAIFTLVASCRLHRLDPLDYLTALLRVLPYWPDDRYIELAPKSWAATRALLDDAELELPLGDITVPPPANA